MWQAHSTVNPGIELRQAAAKGDLEAVKNFLDKRLINCKSSNGNTALHWSIEKKYYAVTKALLTVKEIDLDIQNNQGHTSLHLAARNGDQRTVNRLLKYGAGHKNILDYDGFSPLDYAFLKSNGFIVNKLRKTIPSITFKDKDKFAEVAYEIFKEKNPILIKNPKIFDLDYLCDEKLSIYFLPNNKFTLEEIQAATNKGILDPHKLFCSGNLLHSAAATKIDRQKKFQWLLKMGVDPNQQACHELNPVSYKNTPLHTLILNVAEKDALQFVELAVNLKRKINTELTDSEGKTPLCLAAKVGLALIAKKLMTLNADVNRADENGNTPLHYAFLLGHIDIADELIRHGADQTRKNVENQTPYDLLRSSDIEDVRDCLEITWINPDRKINSKKTYIQNCMINRQIIVSKNEAQNDLESITTINHRLQLF